MAKARSNRKAKLAIVGAVVVVAITYFAISGVQKMQREAHRGSAQKAAEAFVEILNHGSTGGLEVLTPSSFYRDLVGSCNALKACGPPPRNRGNINSRDLGDQLAAEAAALREVCMLSGPDKRHPDCTSDRVRAEFLEMVRNTRDLVGRCEFRTIWRSEDFAVGSGTDDNFMHAFIQCGDVFDKIHLTFDPIQDRWMLHAVPADWLLGVRQRVIEAKRKAQIEAAPVDPEPTSRKKRPRRRR